MSFPNCNKSLISFVRELLKWPCQNRQNRISAVFLFAFPILSQVRKLGMKNTSLFADLRTFYKKKVRNLTFCAVRIHCGYFIGNLLNSSFIFPAMHKEMNHICNSIDYLLFATGKNVCLLWFDCKCRIIHIATGI